MKPKIPHKYWRRLQKIEDEFYKKLHNLEKQIQQETGIEDMEFFWVDNSIVGIGNMSRTVKLIHRPFH